MANVGRDNAQPLLWRIKKSHFLSGEFHSCRVAKAPLLQGALGGLNVHLHPDQRHPHIAGIDEDIGPGAPNRRLYDGNSG